MQSGCVLLGVMLLNRYRAILWCAFGVTRLNWCVHIPDFLKPGLAKIGIHSTTWQGRLKAYICGRALSKWSLEAFQRVEV